MKRMLVDEPWTLDPELSRLYMAKVYRDPTDAVLLTGEEGPAVFYESRTELLAWHRKRVEEANRGPISLGTLLLPASSNFIAAIPQLIRDLPVQLNVSQELLDLTVPSLMVVDNALKRIDMERTLSAPVFSSLTAYVGEVIRLATQGKWLVRVDKDGRGWTPWIVAPNGFECCPALIYKEFLEHQKTASVRTFVKGILGARRLIRRGLKRE